MKDENYSLKCALELRNPLEKSALLFLLSLFSSFYFLFFFFSLTMKAAPLSHEFKEVSRPTLDRFNVKYSI